MRSGIRLVVVAILLATGCAWAQFDDTTMFPLASAVTKLSAAVDAYVSSTANLPSNSNAIIEAATAHDPALRQPFHPYQVRLKIEGRNSAVLVCSLDGRRALIEDAGCTAKVERQAWRESPPPPCVSALDLATVCKR